MANLTKVTVTIDRPVQTVWDKLMDPENLQFWLTGFISAEHLSGEYGKTGAVSRLKFKERGKEMAVTETATAVKAPQQYSFSMTTREFDADTDIRLIDFGSRTEMIQTVEFFPKQFFMKIMMPLIKGVMKKRTENELIRFKNFVETKS